MLGIILVLEVESEVGLGLGIEKGEREPDAGEEVRDGVLNGFWGVEGSVVALGSLRLRIPFARWRRGDMVAVAKVVLVVSGGHGGGKVGKKGVVGICAVLFLCVVD